MNAKYAPNKLYDYDNAKTGAFNWPENRSVSIDIGKNYYNNKMNLRFIAVRYSRATELDNNFWEKAVDVDTSLINEPDFMINEWRKVNTLHLQIGKIFPNPFDCRKYIIMWHIGFGFSNTVTKNSFANYNTKVGQYLFNSKLNETSSFTTPSFDIGIGIYWKITAHRGFSAEF